MYDRICGHLESGVFQKVIHREVRENAVDQPGPAATKPRCNDQPEKDHGARTYPQVVAGHYAQSEGARRRRYGNRVPRDGWRRFARHKRRRYAGKTGNLSFKAREKQAGQFNILHYGTNRKHSPSQPEEMKRAVVRLPIPHHRSPNITSNSYQFTSARVARAHPPMPAFVRHPPRSWRYLPRTRLTPPRSLDWQRPSNLA